MVKIIADSTCDLSKELVDKYNISILPLHILLGEEEYLDGVNITPDEIYTWSDNNNATPKTSAADFEKTYEFFKACVDVKDEVVCFSISGHMSTTCNVMRMVVEELGAEDLIKIVDSENLSTGIGLLILEAARMAQAGCNAKEIKARMEELKPRVRSSFVVDTLTYLHRGGRCSSVAALAGGVLKLHPKIVVENGKMDASKKYRGKINAVIMNYVKDMEADIKNAEPGAVFITHSGNVDEAIESVKEYLTQLGVFDNIYVTRAGGVISSHCGPGTLGVLFISK